MVIERWNFIKRVKSNSFDTVNFQELFLSIQEIRANYYWSFSCLCKPFQVMISTSRKTNIGSKMLVQSIEWKAPNFKLSPTIVETLNPTGAQSQIPSKELLINDIFSHFWYSIQDIRTLEMDESLEKCVNGVLKLEYQHLKAKGLTHIPHMLPDFQIKWIRFILSYVQNG